MKNWFVNPNRLEEVFNNEKAQIRMKAGLEPHSLTLLAKWWCIMLFLVGTFLLTVRMALTLPLF
jgi:hypothetical protein